MTPTEIDIRAIAEAVADVLAERGLVVAPSAPSAPSGRRRRTPRRSLRCSGASASGSMTTRTSSAPSATATGRARGWDSTGSRSSNGSALASVQEWQRVNELAQAVGPVACL